MKSHRNTFITLFLLIYNFCFSQNADIDILKSITAKSKPNWDNAMYGVSHSIYAVLPISVAFTIGHGYYKKDDKIFRNGLRSAASILIATSITSTLKFTVKRPRPFVSYPLFIKQKDKHVGPYSFPSGHTTFAFATATNLSLTYKKWFVMIPAYAYATLLGYSRMRLGVHYPSDVLTGACIGIGSGFLVWKLDEFWLKKKKTKPKVE